MPKVVQYSMIGLYKDFLHLTRNTNKNCQRYKLHVFIIIEEDLLENQQNRKKNKADKNINTRRSIH